MLVTSFTFSLGCQILPRFAVVGKFDGKYPSLACVAASGKIVMHCPHDASLQAQNKVKFLNFNSKVTCLAAGDLNAVPGATAAAKDSRDLLFIGTQSNILAYDVDRNADVFYRDVDDASCMSIGVIGSMTKPLLFVGGNILITGYDNEGNEAFSSLTGDNISASMICDVDADGVNELAIGSEDFFVRFFKDVESSSELTEADKIIILVPIRDSMFAYGLSNGTVGVYDGKKRLWRVKTKNSVTAISISDVDGDNLPEVLIGWDNGSFQARKYTNGEVIFKDKMSGPIAAIVCADYRMDGKSQIIICCENGDVRAMLPADADIAALQRISAGNNDTGSIAVAMKENEEDQKKIAELEAAKRKLNNELKQINRNKPQKGRSNNEISPGALPPGTNINYKLIPDINSRSLNLRLDVVPEAVYIANIIAVDLEGGVLEQNEVLAISPSRVDKTAIFHITPRKYHNCSIRIQTHIGAKSQTAAQMHVFEKEIVIPKFSNFWKLPNETTTQVGSMIKTEVNGKERKFQEPGSKVTFKLDETTQKVGEYIHHSFVLQVGASPPIRITQNEVTAIFVSVCGPSEGKILIISARPDGRSPNLDVCVQCDDLDVVSEIMQDMAKFLKKSELDSEANFPKTARSFAEVTQRVDDLNSARNKMAVDTASDSQQIKALIVRAEDARLMCDMASMKRAYLDLMNMNKELIVRHEHRAKVQEDLIAGLKEINLMIHKTSNLRVGKAKEAIVKDCRAAIKANKMTSLTDIMRISSKVDV